MAQTLLVNSWIRLKEVKIPHPFTFKLANFKKISFVGMVMISISGCQKNDHSKKVREDSKSPAPQTQVTRLLDAEFQVVEPYLKSLIQLPAFYLPGPYLKKETKSSTKGSLLFTEVEERILNPQNQVIKSTIKKTVKSNPF
jgi:hypothetical protein